MHIRPQTLTGAGARFLRECTELMHVAVVWASAEVIERAPEAAKRLGQREGQTYLRLKDQAAARVARDAAMSALQEMSRLSGEAVGRFKDVDRTLADEIKRIADGGDRRDDFDCCDIVSYQHILRQYEVVLISCLAEFHTQTAAYYQQFSCDYVCDPHPCAPELFFASETSAANTAARDRRKGSRKNQGEASGS